MLRQVYYIGWTVKNNSNLLHNVWMCVPHGCRDVRLAFWTDCAIMTTTILSQYIGQPQFE